MKVYSFLNKVVVYLRKADASAKYTEKNGITEAYEEITGKEIKDNLQEIKKDRIEKRKS